MPPDIVRPPASGAPATAESSNRRPRKNVISRPEPEVAYRGKGSASIELPRRGTDQAMDSPDDESLVTETAMEEIEYLRKKAADEERMRHEADQIIDERQEEILKLNIEVLKLRRQMAVMQKTQMLEQKRRKQQQQQQSLKDLSPDQRLNAKAPALEPSDSAVSVASTTNDGEPAANALQPQRPRHLVPRIPLHKPTASNASSDGGSEASNDAGRASTAFGEREAVAAYGALIQSVKRFVQNDMAHLFVNYKHLDPATLAAPRLLLKMMSTRAGLFLRLKDSDGAHFFALLMEYLRQKVFCEQCGGIFLQPPGRTPLEARFVAIDNLSKNIAAMIADSNTRRFHREARAWRLRMLNSIVPDWELAIQRPIEAWSTMLSMELAGILQPLKLDATPSLPQNSKSSLRAGSETDQPAKAPLDTILRTELIEPAVRLAVNMDMSLNGFVLEWVEHANDSPSLSVCETLGLDYKRIDLDKSSEPYSFLFDISPGLFIIDYSSQDHSAPVPSIIYAQGVLLQKGVVQTQPTFIRWLHDNAPKPKGMYLLCLNYGPVNPTRQGETNKSVLKGSSTLPWRKKGSKADKNVR